ncbi:MAG: TetR/AcrR family transcriptional regulator [Desulfobacterales bacterium]|nr:TetR/AcrR family transcriptional regulator [Desulfobacterales bacterium]
MGVQERRKLEKEHRRQQILDAARNLLFSQGIEKISISRISRESELGVGTIYFHYKNKEEIFIALQQEGLSVLHTIISSIAETEIEPDVKLRKIAKAFYRFTETHTEYYNIINYFLSSPKVFFEADKKQQIDMSGTKILTVIQDIIAIGNTAGFFMEKDPVKFSIMFWGTLNGLVQFKKLEHTTLQNQAHKEIYDYSVDKLIQSIIWE